MGSGQEMGTEACVCVHVCVRVAPSYSRAFSFLFARGVLHCVRWQENAKALSSALSSPASPPLTLSPSPASSRRSFVYVVLFTSQSRAASVALISNTRVKF